MIKPLYHTYPMADVMILGTADKILLFKSSRNQSIEVKSGKEDRIRNLNDGGKYKMLRSMMQVFVKNSTEAVALYQKAFDAELLCAKYWLFRKFLKV